MDYDIRTYGAVADGKTLNTAAIQAAVDACTKAGGGRVIVPAGGEFLSGGIILKNNVNLHFEHGARMQASKDEKDYAQIPSRHNNELIYAGHADNVLIDGEGILTGNGEALWGHYWGVRDPLHFRVACIYMEECSNVRVYDVTILRTDWYAIQIKLSEDVFISRVKVFNYYFHLNSDGIDPDSSKNVTISDCHVVSGDDCICPKSAVPGRPMENLTVTNCVLKTPMAAIKLGTTTVDVFRDILFSNITIEGSSVGAGIYMRDGGLVERISFDNITYTYADLEDQKTAIPIYIDVDRRSTEVGYGKVRDISFTNWHINSAVNCVLQGSAESHIEDLMLSNITFRVPKPADYTKRIKSFGGKRRAPDDGRDFIYVQTPAAIAVAYTEGLTTRDISLYMDEPAKEFNLSALYMAEVKDAFTSNIRRFGLQCEDQLPVVYEEDGPGVLKLSYEKQAELRAKQQPAAN